MSNTKLITIKEEAIEILKSNSSKIECCSQELRDDEDVILEATKSWPGLIVYASSRLKADKQFVLKFFDTTTEAWSYYTSSLLNLLDQKLHDDEEVVFKAVSKSPLDFRNASKRLQNDENYVRMLISSNIQKDNEGVVIRDYSRLILCCCGESLQKNRQFILDMLDTNPIGAFTIADSSLKDDEEVVLKAAKLGVIDLDNISNRLLTDKNFIIKLLQVISGLLKDADFQLRNDKEMVMSAMTRIRYIIQCRTDVLNVLDELFSLNEWQKIQNNEFKEKISALYTPQKRIISIEKEMLEEIYNTLSENLKVDPDIVNISNFDEENKKENDLIHLNRR